MTSRILALLLLCACNAPAHQAPSAPPSVEPPAKRVAIVSGHVLDASGLVAQKAIVRAWAAEADCQPVGGATTVSAEDSREFEVRVEIEVDSTADDCIVIEAAGGGAIGRATVAATFAESPARARVDVRLGAPPPLTRADADRMIAQLARAIGVRDETAIGALSPFVPRDAEAFGIALDEYRTLLGSVERWRVALEEWPQPGRDQARLVYELRGTTGKSSEVEVHQDATRRMHSPVLYYAAHARSLTSRLLQLAARGAVEEFARALTVDDVDYPLGEARAMMERLRSRFDDLSKVELEFVDHQASRALLRYRLVGTRGGAHVEIPISFRYGDGLLGIHDVP